MAFAPSERNLIFRIIFFPRYLHPQLVCIQDVRLLHYCQTFLLLVPRTACMMGKSWGHFCHLDEHEYLNILSQLGEAEIREQHVLRSASCLMKRKLLSASLGATASVGAAFCTYEASLLSNPVSL